MKHIILTVALILMSTTIFAKPSDWRAIQAVVLPSDTVVYEGVTKNGNAKYWIDVKGIKISISEANAEKLKSGEAQIELVKWVNIKTDEYKYTTRRKVTPKPVTPNLDLTKLF